ncbi:hypothetical protein HZB08_01710, partial [Candidatus Saganbacteria bacterium]|nr:hypothetical protein [Candidatus Saganbacteria bacterium]
FYIVAGLDMGSAVSACAMCAPFLVAGALFGAAASGGLNRDSAQKMIYLMIALMGAMMLR